MRLFSQRMQLNFQVLCVTENSSSCILCNFCTMLDLSLTGHIANVIYILTNSEKKAHSFVFSPFRIDTKKFIYSPYIHTKIGQCEPGFSKCSSEFYFSVGLLDSSSIPFHLINSQSPPGQHDCFVCVRVKQFMIGLRNPTIIGRLPHYNGLVVPYWVPVSSNAPAHL